MEIELGGEGGNSGEAIYVFRSLRRRRRRRLSIPFHSSSIVANDRHLVLVSLDCRMGRLFSPRTHFSGVPTGGAISEKLMNDVLGGPTEFYTGN